ncbi:hypothetical protein EJB05_09029 [Eragrostis curvula]|uniref:DUF8040 domain-containing protein n=1 Tax=Eragrostis curvula TaxID=38414 RepID=A0A5J9W5K1_9POAL|nr:hypothetical protein EJB05_09029 [Eragrostis curvula]
MENSSFLKLKDLSSQQIPGIGTELMSEITDDEMKRLLSIVKWSKRGTMTPLVHRLTTTDAERFALKLKKGLIDKLNLKPAVTIQFKVDTRNQHSIQSCKDRMSASIEEYSYNSDTSSAYSSDTSSDASSIIYHVAAFGVAATALAISKNNEQPAVAHHPPLPFPHVTERQWVQLNLHNPTRCWKNFRMSPISFLHLHELLVRHHGLQSTQVVESIEALAMFVWSCAHAQPAGQIEDKFERSASTVSRKMSEVGQVIFHFANYDTQFIHHNNTCLIHCCE